MSNPVEISVIITTYNRCELLCEALENVLDQETITPYEVVVVDNNSTDRTRELVEGYVARGNSRLKYVFEPNQGISYGRNTGLANSRGQIIAFTDDDVRVDRHWLKNIKRVFDDHPEIEFLGGKILPLWETEPPHWLTQDHWWPLALLDYGDEPLYVSSDHPACLPTANAAYRREIFDEVGLFSTKLSGSEDYEMLLRLYRIGKQGLYIPQIVVTTEVPASRRVKAYHRSWSYSRGRFNSIMRMNEIIAPDGRLMVERSDAIRLFGVPASLYRNFLAAIAKWIPAFLSGHESRALQHENLMFYLAGYVRTRYDEDRLVRRHSSLTELYRFTKALISKKIRSKMSS